jgi:hypothetical protein
MDVDHVRLAQRPGQQGRDGAVPALLRGVDHVRIPAARTPPHARERPRQPDQRAEPRAKRARHAVTWTPAGVEADDRTLRGVAEPARALALGRPRVAEGDGVGAVVEVPQLTRVGLRLRVKAVCDLDSKNLHRPVPWRPARARTPPATRRTTRRRQLRAEPSSGGRGRVLGGLRAAARSPRPPEMAGRGVVQRVSGRQSAHIRAGSDCARGRSTSALAVACRQSCGSRRRMEGARLPRSARRR